MANSFEEPRFDRVSASEQVSAVAVPQDFIDVPQGLIRDMLIDCPGMALSPDAVKRDRKTGHRFVETYYRMAQSIVKSEIYEKPFIGKLPVLRPGQDPTAGYIVDYRYVENLMFPSTDLGYDEEIGLESIRTRNEMNGTVPAVAAIMQLGSKTHRLSPVISDEQMLIFQDLVDRLVIDGFAKAKSVTLPAYIEALNRVDGSETAES